MSLLARLFRRRPKLTFRPLTDTAQLPTYATPGAAGLDLVADEDVTIPFLKRALVKTNVAVDLPDGIEAQVRARSGIALKKGIAVLNAPGTIDPDYTGGIGVILFNTDMEDFVVRKGDRIAQLVIAPFVRVEPVWSGALQDETLTVRETKRGAGGFGSTGVAGLAAATLLPGLAPAAHALDLPLRIETSSIRADALRLENVVIDNKEPSAGVHIKAAQWFEGDPELMNDFSRPFVFRADGSREFLDGKPSARETENTRIQREVEDAVAKGMRQLHLPGGALHQA